MWEKSERKTKSGAVDLGLVGAYQPRVLSTPPGMDYDVLK